MMILGGDFINGDGTGGESIYGTYFKDENFIHRHDKPFLLGMSNAGEYGTNSSQFYITCKESKWLDKNNVVFGEVVEGQDLIKQLSYLGMPNNMDKPEKAI